MTHEAEYRTRKRLFHPSPRPVAEEAEEEELERTKVYFPFWGKEGNLEKRKPRVTAQLRGTRKVNFEEEGMTLILTGLKGSDPAAR